MSEGVIVALITTIGGVFVALIGFLGSWVFREQGNNSGNHSNVSNATIALVTLIAAFIGLLIGVTVGLIFVSVIPSNPTPPPQTVVAIATPIPPTNAVIVVTAMPAPVVATDTPLPTTFVPPNTLVPPPIDTPQFIPQRPTSIHVINGTNYSIPTGWTWVCTGDFSTTDVNGIKKSWYDVGVSTTGLVLVLQPNSSNFTLNGPFEVSANVGVGDCYPHTQDEKVSAISEAINAQFNNGCGSKCQYVNIIELGNDGNEINNYWLPQKP